MIKVIRRYQKSFLALGTVLLTLTFLVNRGNSGGTGGSDPVFATVLGKNVYASDMAQAHAELQALNHSVRTTNEQGASRSILDALLGPDLAQEIGSKPEWFLMLRNEADAANIQVSSDEVNRVMVNYTKNLDPDSDDYAAAKAGVTDLFKILMRYEQVASSIKVTQPMRDNMMAKFGETLSLNLVQINASDFLVKVPAPTTQQVQEQFTKFASTTPHIPVKDTNPFGFGYKLPVRGKLQYLRVSPDAVANAVIATKSNYEWEVAGRKFYYNDPDQFAIKPPTTGPADAPSTQPAIPQTYEQAHDQVLRTIRTPLVTALMEQVRSYLATTLNSDYQAYLKVMTANPGGAEPDSSMGVRYSSFSYLSKLIDAVKSRFHVDITANETADISTKQMGDIFDIGSEQLTKFVDGQESTYLDKVEKKDPTALAQLMKPSPPLEWSDRKTDMPAIIFARLIDALPSAPATDLVSIQSQVETDFRFAAAYKMAKEQADFLLQSAKAGGLISAAIATKHPVIPINGDNALSSYSSDVKGVFPPLGDSARSFDTQAFSMLSSYNPKTNPHPATVIDLPEQGRLFVTQLTDVTAMWSPETYFSMATYASNDAVRDQQEKLREDWFKYDAVKTRTDLKLVK